MARWIIPVINLAILEICYFPKRNRSRRVGRSSKPALKGIYDEKPSHERFDKSERLPRFLAGGLTHLVIHKSRIFHSKGLNCRGGIHGALKSDPEGFGTGLAITLSTKEAA